MTNILQNRITEAFPLPVPRPGQLDAVGFIMRAFESGKKFAILEGPCGCGKSALAMAVAMMHPRAYWVTSTKALQDQLCADFGEQGRFCNHIVDLKGRNAYDCPYRLDPRLHRPDAIQKWESTKPHNAADGHCRRRGKSAYKECLENGLCPYFIQRAEAINSKICLMNFASFLHQTSFTRQFLPRGLMIIDEGHNVETQLLSFVTLTISDSRFGGLKMPQYDNPDDYAIWFEYNKIEDMLKADLNRARAREDVQEIDELEATIRKLGLFMSEMSKEDHDPWVVEYEAKRNVARAVFKPVFVHKYAHQHLFNFAGRILIMSATILDVNVMTRSLSIDRGQVAAKRMGSKFPSDNHPIYFRPAARIRGGKASMDSWGPPLIKAVDEICLKHEGQRGIIHTHNFYIAEMLIEKCDQRVRSRLLFQRDFKDKTHMLEFHGVQKDSILIAPAMHEGLDLKDSLSRFQIICKVPFPNHYEDKQLAARMEVDPHFYEWLTALKLCQSIGRSVRSEEDWATTYIVDGSFEWWYKRNQKILPNWLKESIKTVRQTS